MFRREIAVFHVQMGGCRGCGEIVDSMLADRISGSPITLECVSPRHAGLIVVTGLWTQSLGEAVLKVISKAPDQHRLALVGDCALGKGIIASALSMTECISDFLAGDMEIEGCPVELKSLLEGVRRVSK